MKRFTDNMTFFLLILLVVTMTISTCVYASCDTAETKILATYLALELRYNADYRDTVRVGYISEGGYRTINTTFIRGNTYFILGAGDGGVRDLDIILYDENWNEIDRDTQTDESPIVKVTPKWTGEFHIRVKMYSGSGCAYLGICYF